MLQEFQIHNAVIGRLRRMKQELAKRTEQKEANPFRKTFLEKARESAGGAMSIRQESIKAKVHWFAISELSREDLAMELDKAFKIPQMQTILNDNRGIDYAVDTVQATSLGFNGIDFDTEYQQMMREASAKGVQTNDLDFSVSGSHPKLITGSAEWKLLECSETKRTTEGAFTPTKMWQQSEDYLPGEKWDPSLKFEKLPHTMVESHESGFVGEASRVLSAMLAPEAVFFAPEAV
jgi:hypothetical protein